MIRRLGGSALLLAALALLAGCAGREVAYAPPPERRELQLIDPVEGAAMSSPAVPVRGKVLGGPALLGLNGRPLELAADGTFQTRTDLVEGANRLVFDLWAAPAAMPGTTLLPTTPPLQRLVRTVQFQRPQLAIRFTAPAEGTVLRQTPAQVAGMVSDPSAAVNVQGLPAEVDADGRFSLSVPLASGANLLHARARAHGRSAEAVLNLVHAPPVAPRVRILEPAEGALTRAAVVPVKGTVSDPAATLTVQGRSVPVAADGSWSTTLSPPEGPLTLQARAMSADGLAGSDEIRLFVDRTPPRIELDAPAKSPTRLTQLPLSGQVVDATATQLWLQEAAAPLTGPPSAARFATSAALQEGPNTLVFRAVDAAGNAATLELLVVRDTQGPGILLDPLPADGTCNLTVSGRAEDPAGGVTFTRDGERLPAVGNGFSFFWALQPGSNATTLRATDGLGNTSERVLVRSCVGEPPPPPPAPLTLTVLGPAEGQVFSSPSAPYSGRVSDPSAAVTVNGIGCAVAADGAFAGSVPLTSGANTLAFHASASGGRVASEVRHVTLQPGGGSAPVITFDDPRDGYATSARAITVLGRVDDARASLKLQGKDVPLDAQGRFQLTVEAEREGVLGIRAEATNAFGTGRNAIYVSFQWSPLQMAWADPTPAEGARLTTAQLAAAVTLSRAALVEIHGQSAALEPNEAGPHPFRAQAELAVEEGQLLLTATAVDGGGHRATLARRLAVGLTAPTLTFTAPDFDAAGAFRTLQAGVTVAGAVTAPEAVKPLTLTLNGQAVPLDADGRFTWTFTGLGYGANPLRAVATSAFGQASSAERTVERVQEHGEDPAPRLTLDEPLEGFATGQATILASGRVNRAGLQVAVQGRAVEVDPLTLRFAATVELAAGPNTLLATARDDQGRSDSASVRGTRFVPGQSRLRWDLPAAGARLASRTVRPSGQADQPGIASVRINGVAMALSGSGSEGAFLGELGLAKGPQTLLLEAETLAGEILTERREVIIDPPLPRLLLSAPDAARSAEEVTLAVQPVPGTRLQSVDLSWNGALLAHLAEPFAPQKALVPATAQAGERILVEALGRDLEGETVLARAYVVVLAGGPGGSGPLVLSAFDDRSGLRLAGAAAFADGHADPIALGDSGRGTVPNLKPGAWVKVEKAGHVPVWRRAEQLGSKPRALFDARPTTLAASQEVGPSGFSGSFAKGAIELSLPALTGAGRVSATPLSTQGLPALLPRGWSAVAALWLQLEGTALVAPGSVQLSVQGSLAGLVWARWDEALREWTALQRDLALPLGTLPLPATGGYALLAADPAPATPPESAQILLGSTAVGWREGLAAGGSVEPSVLPTVEAIRGARAGAKLDLGFGGQEPIPSGAAILAEVLETYTLVDQALIEPEKRVQDAVAARFVLGVDKEGRPTLRPVNDGLGLELPLRMSRTFVPTELVDGLIQVGFYHEDQKIEVGGELIGTAGGSTTRDGITATFAEGAFTSSALVKVQADPAESWAGLWPELDGKGRVASSFSVDIAGALTKGMELSFADLGSVPPGVLPLVVQRRNVADQRVMVAVGALQFQGGLWKLTLPEESNPILEGGSFAVLVPIAPWAWVTGVVSMPQGLAQLMAARSTGRKSPSSPASLIPKGKAESTGMKGMQGMPSKAIPVNPRVPSAALPAGDVAVPDALVTANLLQAASGPAGVFALPVLAPATGKLPITGSRWDLGLRGSLDVDAPSAGNALRLTTIPFAITAILPPEGSLLETSAIFTVLTSTPMDEASLAGVRLLRIVADGSETAIPLRRQLSLDGRTLLITPEALLPQDAELVLRIEGLRSNAGEVAPTTERRFRTRAPEPPPAECDFTRITLGYPDASFAVLMTIPAGAIPAGASLLIEGLGMGYTYSGTMPNGELQLPIRASRGERIKITVQIAGRTTIGHVSRYEAGDGRVTIGIDGGRVATTDGKAAATFPVGAFDRPIEVRAEFVAGVPEDLDPSVAGQLPAPSLGQIRLWSPDRPEPRVRPILEFPLPADPLTAKCPDGLGPYGIYDRVEGSEEDGSPSIYYQYADSARMVDGRIRSFGGLVPLADPEIPGVAPGWAGWFAGSRNNQESDMAPGRRVTRGALANASAHRALATGMQPMLTSAVEAIFMIGFGSANGGHGDRFISGFAYRKLPGENVKPVEGAFIFFQPAGYGTIRRNGRLLQRTGKEGSYILAASLTDAALRDGGEIMGQDPDYGVRAFTAANDFSTPNSRGDRYCHPDPLVFNITPADQEDRIAPWAELQLDGTNVLGASEVKFREGGTWDVKIVLSGNDNRSNSQLFAEIVLDGKPIPASRVTFSRVGRIRSWTTSLPVLPLGVHSIEARLEDGNHNLTRIQREFHVLAFPDSPPVNAAYAPTFDLELEGSPDLATTSTVIQVRFSEPVQNVSDQSLLLEKKEASGVWSPVTVRRISNQGVLPLPTGIHQRIHVVHLIPMTRLELGGEYRVLGTNAIVDFDDPERFLEQAPITFRVASWTDLDLVPLPAGPIRRVAVIGGRTFVASATGIHVLRVGGATTNRTPVRFGATGAGGDFFGQEIVEMKVFRQATVGSSLADLLLVTTAPRAGEESQQCALWVFNACSQLPVPNLMFAVSLGPGASGYAPNVDCRGGWIAVGRLTGSNLMVSLQAGWAGWVAEAPLGLPISAVIHPAGRNQQAIAQSFYLANPEGPNLLTHPGIALLPQQPDGRGGLLPGLPVAVGFPAPGIQRDNKPLRGLPNLILATGDNGALVPEPPFKPVSWFGAPGPYEPDARAYPGPIGNGGAATRIAVIPSLRITEGGTTRDTTLAIGLSALPSGYGGNSLVFFDEAIPKVPKLVGKWPRAALSPGGQPYEIPYVAPSVDPVTRLVAVPVRFPATNSVSWFVLDLSTPDDPRTVARIDGGSSWWGSLFNGILSTGATSGAAPAVVLRRIVPGVANIDEGQCELFLNRKTAVLSEPGSNWEAPESGFRLGDLEVQLGDRPRVKLQEADYLIVRFVAQPGTPLVGPIPARAIDPEMVVWKLTLTLTGVESRAHTLRIWGSDRARNPFKGLSWTDHWQGKPFEAQLFFASENP